MYVTARKHNLCYQSKETREVLDEYMVWSLILILLIDHCFAAHWGVLCTIIYPSVINKIQKTGRSFFGAAEFKNFNETHTSCKNTGFPSLIVPYELLPVFTVLWVMISKRKTQYIHQNPSTGSPTSTRVSRYSQEPVIEVPDMRPRFSAARKWLK